VYKKNNLTIALIFLSLCLSFVNVSQAIASKDIHSKIEQGEDVYLPEFSLENIYPGQPNLTRRDFLGRYTVLSYFASWCGFCRAKHPQILKLSKESKINFYGVALSDEINATQEFLLKNDNTYVKVAADSSGSLAYRIFVKGIPQIMVINRSGKIIGLLYDLSIDELQDIIRKDSLKSNNKKSI
jgi:thiol-disulfide isomerase/thioredoxin